MLMQGADTMQPPRAPSTAYANYVLALLCLVFVMNFIDRQILAMLIEPIKQEFGVSDSGRCRSGC
ncbi:MAG: hypothetical protein KDI23_02595 [Pseudomonadales bacterium]|nr:hypothetical protein [Pseudomonadales bacterium]